MIGISITGWISECHLLKASKIKLDHPPPIDQKKHILRNWTCFPTFPWKPPGWWLSDSKDPIKKSSGTNFLQYLSSYLNWSQQYKTTWVVPLPSKPIGKWVGLGIPGIHRYPRTYRCFIIPCGDEPAPWEGGPHPIDTATLSASQVFCTTSRGFYEVYGYTV